MVMMASEGRSSASIAIVGGGITGACVASTLAKLIQSRSSHKAGLLPAFAVSIDVFDQGRSGVGGRTSHRITREDAVEYRFDHGCQFFRGDTDKFREVALQEWLDKGYVREWQGTFHGDDGSDFFGLPSQPPFYTAAKGGIKSISKSLLDGFRDLVTVHEGKRVIGMERTDAGQWKFLGTAGEGAYHDTPESVAQAAAEHYLTERSFDVVILTDIISSFDAWHRASAGVPREFAKRVLEAAGARVPLFTCMLAFEEDVEIDLSGAALKDDDTLWFAGRTKSKPGLEGTARDCWTLVSTPEYAVRQIEETPMQDPTTGAFRPQSSDYLTTVPGPDLERAFRKALAEGKFGTVVADIPKTCFLAAQRWGSALPAHRHLDETSPTRRILSGVAYDPGRAPLAPTRLERTHKPDGSDRNFVADVDQMLFQAGDMVSNYTPGFESAALSGIEVAEYVYELLHKVDEKSDRAVPSEGNHTRHNNSWCERFCGCVR